MRATVTIEKGVLDELVKETKTKNKATAVKKVIHEYLRRKKIEKINPSTFPGLKPGVCSGLILSGAFHPVLKDAVWRRRSINKIPAFVMPNLFRHLINPMAYETLKQVQGDILGVLRRPLFPHLKAL